MEARSCWRAQSYFPMTKGEKKPRCDKYCFVNKSRVNDFDGFNSENRAYITTSRGFHPGCEIILETLIDRERIGARREKAPKMRFSAYKRVSRATECR